MKSFIIIVLSFLLTTSTLAMYDPNRPVSSDEISNRMIPISANDNAPRIMYWFGKVNQHFDLNKQQWATDPDGVSGANLDKLEYCRKFYPNTVEVREYKEETTDNWKNRGNLSQFTSTKMSYLCIQGEREVDQPLISYITSHADTNSAIVKWISKDKDTSYISYYQAADYKIFNQTSSSSLLRSDINNSAVACPMDARQCPDGSWVSRVAPDCQFAPCRQDIEVDEGEAIIVKNDQLTTHHSLTIKNLEPNTIYYYKIHSFAGTDREVVSQEYRFRTSPLKPIVIDNQIYQIRESADLLSKGNSDPILEELNQLRNRVREQEMEIKYLKNLNEDLRKVSEQMQTALNEFITYGVDENTLKLGEGERAAVIHSYRQAFDKLPETEAELEDAIKIANGRFPSITNENAEERAKNEFKVIYKREADLNNERDRAAITIMAYGLRQRAENRNLDSERQGINTFKNIYNRVPSSTQDWNIMQAITYSGATR